MSFLNGSTDTTIAPKAETTQTVLPDWYTNYGAQIVANQGAVSARPYETYQGPRIAGFNPDQERSFELTRQVARPTGLQGVEGMIQGAAGMSGAGAAQPFLTRAAGMDSVGAASPSYGEGAGLYRGSTDPTGISLASPFLNTAAGRSTDAISSYMDPYRSNVVDYVGDLAARNVSEKLLPSLTDRFIKAGQFSGGPGGEAPSRFAMELGRGIRDIEADTLGQQSKLLSEGYQSALQASNSDLARQAQLAGTAGTLGSQQQEALARAASGITGIGTNLGQLTSDQQRNLTSIGQTTGNLTTQDAQTALQAAQQMAAVQQQRQDMGIKGASALQAVGNQQQGQEQKNLDLGLQDFLAQKGYDQQQIDAMVKTLGGVQPAVPKASLSEGYGPVGDTTTSPSTLQTLAGLAATVGPFLKGL